MTGRDRSVGWCEVDTNGEVYYLPRAEYGRIETALNNRKGGWHEVTDVYGADQMFRLRDVIRLTDMTPAALRIRDAEEAEDRLLNGDE